MVLRNWRETYNQATSYISIYLATDKLSKMKMVTKMTDGTKLSFRTMPSEVTERMVTMERIIYLMMG